MKKGLLMALGCWLWAAGSSAQTVAQRLQKAFGKFEADSQLRHAISSLYVIDANTGEVVFDKNSQVGLAPASTQKIITSVTAYELLGKEYKYKTEFGYNGTIDKGLIKGTVFIIANGDPTFGSWRWQKTKRTEVLDKILKSFQYAGVTSLGGNYELESGKWESQKLPDRWIWQDVGNYYGAAAYKLNWNENQYDLFLRSGDKIGDSVHVVKTEPGVSNIISEVRSAAKGTGDNAYIYLPLGYPNTIVRGTIPIDEKAFKISGALLNPEGTFFLDFLNTFSTAGIPSYNGKYFENLFNKPDKIEMGGNSHILYSHESPPLDSIIYWFNKKSINLYGEALVKTFAYEKQGFGSTDSGVAILKKFWKEKGLDDEELNMYDGSGLSPMNRVTTHAQVEILKFAKSRPWYASFYHSLPEYNGMKVKSGTIGDVKGFCGYHKAKDGKEYIFSFLVNNYSGRSSALVGKMYKVMDELK